PSQLTLSTSFRRIVTSTPYCADTSNFIKIAVLPSVTGNIFSKTDTAICDGTSPGRIILNYPGGGDGNFTFEWQSRSTAGWNSLPNTTDSVSFTEGILTATTDYRRIAYSGFNNACIDTSNIQTISVRPQVSNNLVEGSVIKYTCYNSAVSLTGSEPSNGFGPGTYSYLWEESENNSDWQESTGVNRDFLSGNLISTRYFRRKVFSTPQYHECLNISPSVEVRINPLPTGNIFSTSDTVCAGSALQVKFNIEGDGPFNVSVKGDIETAKSLTGITGPTDSIEFNPTITQDFVLVSVEDDSGCFADVSGFVPLIPGIVYEVPVANAGADDEACGDTYTLNAVKTNATYKGLWTATDAVLLDSTSENATVTACGYGEHVFKWTEMNWQCADDDEVAITFFEQPQTPEAGTDQELNFIYTTQLQASPPSAGNGTWTVTSGACDFNDISIPDAIVSELDDVTVLKWTVINGICSAVSDSVKISVRPLELKKAYTPNGDDLNDYFYLGALNAENVNIKIFNRSGQLVFESDNYCGGEFSGSDCKIWDGHNKNNVELPEGTYFYIIRMKIAGRTKEIEFKSFVEIIR
ncbi:MAG TPA: gliding motility-associated C-terminal domain-containing protein, partial [Bacteroidales bacterium]|nr:gliding motility-associated C-terminal domain-containing protein [Bacteroidales bacterium]